MTASTYANESIKSQVNNLRTKIGAIRSKANNSLLHFEAKSNAYDAIDRPPLSNSVSVSLRERLKTVQVAMLEANPPPAPQLIGIQNQNKRTTTIA